MGADRGHGGAVCHHASGFIPAQDQGYFLAIVQLPSGASLERTDGVVLRWPAHPAHQGFAAR
jgi:multidrug efflux pump subunit AcrB